MNEMSAITINLDDDELYDKISIYLNHFERPKPIHSHNIRERERKKNCVLKVSFT